MNICKILNWNSGEICKNMNDQLCYVHKATVALKLKPELLSGVTGIQNHNLCDTGAVLHQLSFFL